MKDKLKEYLPKAESERMKIWKDGVFILDANVLLNMFRYSKKSCDELLGIIKTHKDNLWLPYQVAREFFDNREGVVEGIKSNFDRLLEYVSKVESTLEDGLKFKDFRSDTALNIDQLRKDIREFRKREETKIKKWQKEYEDSDKDAVLDEILTLYEGKVGDDYDENTLKQLYESGKERYAKQVPPGFADLKEKEKQGERHLYGDLIWWKQAIDYARDNKRDLVIITDDKKEDWWYKVSGKIRSPRVELIREFDKETKGMSFIMYKTHQFMEMAKQLDGASVSDSSIKEAEETGSISYNQLANLFQHEDSPVWRSRLTGQGIIGRRRLADMPTLDRPYVVGNYDSQELQGILGVQGTQGVQGYKGIRGVIDGSIMGAYPYVDSDASEDGLISRLSSYYDQNPDGMIKLTGLTEDTQKWIDNIRGKKDK